MLVYRLTVLYIINMFALYHSASGYIMTQKASSIISALILQWYLIQMNNTFKVFILKLGIEYILKKTTFLMNLQCMPRNSSNQLMPNQATDWYTGGQNHPIILLLFLFRFTSLRTAGLSLLLFSPLPKLVQRSLSNLDLRLDGEKALLRLLLAMDDMDVVGDVCWRLSTSEKNIYIYFLKDLFRPIDCFVSVQIISYLYIQETVRYNLILSTCNMDLTNKHIQ